MNFGQALAKVKEGFKISRDGWNGSGQFVYYVPEASYPPSTDVAKEEFGHSVPYAAYLAIKSVQNVVVPWLASQTDLLAEDWYVVE